ncbi:MAG: winged helix-turn-helix domain-containing protein [Pseudomonadota bacterium]
MKYWFGACQLDVARRELTCNGAPIELQPQTFSLLSLLLENHHRAVSKDEIFETVWEGRAVSDSVLTTRMRSLRRAIDADEAESHIKTLHRVGYRFASGVVQIDDDEPASEEPSNIVVRDLSAEGQVDDAVDETDTVNSDAGLAANQTPLTSGRPSIAILPLENFSSDDEADYFSDGLSEDLITAVSKFREISVVGRNSSFSLRHANLSITEISRKLNARYVVEGSVRRSQDRVRVTVQLIDGIDDTHVWAEKYDRRIEDIFDLQDEITRAVVLSLLPHVSLSERKRAQRKHPNSLDAWEHYQFGISLSHAYTEVPVKAAIEHFEKAVDLDPGFAEAHSELSFWLSVLAQTSEPGQDWEEACQRAERSAKMALDLDELSPKAWIAQARINMLKGVNDGALVAAKQSIEINPNSAFGYYILGKALWQSGRPRKAIDEFRYAIDLDPTDWWKSAALGSIASALAMIGKYDQALSVVQEADTAHVQRNIMTSLGELCALGHLGREADARAALIAANKATRRYGNHNEFTLKYIDKAFPMSEGSAKEHFFDGLRRANLPSSGKAGNQSVAGPNFR